MKTSWLLIVALSCFGVTARAQGGAQSERTDDQRARDHYEAGTSYFEQRRFAEAAVQFRDAYRLSGRLSLLLNVATCLERVEDFDGAADALDEWLEHAPPDTENRRTQETRRDQARARHAEQAVAEPAEPIESTGPIEPTEPPPEEPSGLPTAGRLGVALLSVGAALGVVAIGTGVAGSSAQDDLENGCNEERVCPPELESTRDRGRRLVRASSAFTFLAGAAGAAGLTALLVSLLRSDDDEASVRAVAGPGDVGVGVDVRF
ncbi:MAG: hypothetical protein AAGE52_06320 [Myxococcota bacterium]